MRRAFALVLLAMAAVSAGAAGGGGRQPSAQAPAPPAAAAGQMYVIGSIVAFEARCRVPMGVELRPFATKPATPAKTAGDETRVVPLPITPPVLAGGNPRVAVSPPLIRQALDDFVAVNPGYVWAVTGPIIGVVPAGALNDAGDWLNATVPSFAVRAATVRDALVALRRTFDTSYDEGRVVEGRTPSAGPASTQAAVQERVEQARARRFDVTLEGGRVRDVLDAIVLSHGEASWLVTFEGSLPVAERARVEVAFWQGSSMIAYPAAGPIRAPSPPPARAPAPRLVTVPLTRETLHSTLSELARTAGRSIGFRLGPDCGGDGHPAPARLLNLEGVGFEEAVDLALGNCPGYEQHVVGGVLNIVPAGTMGKDVVLDGGTWHFKVVNMPFRDTMWEVVRHLRRRGAEPRSRPRPTIESDRVWATALDQAKPVTVDLKKATLRAALNAVVAAHGAAWWAIDGPSPQGLVRLTMGGSGWSESWAGAPTR